MPGRVLSGHSMGLVVILLGSHTFKCGLLVECQFVYEIFTGSNSSQVSVRVDTFCSPTYQKTMSSTWWGQFITYYIIVIITRLMMMVIMWYYAPIIQFVVNIRLDLSLSQRSSERCVSQVALWPQWTFSAGQQEVLSLSASWRLMYCPVVRYSNITLNLTHWKDSFGYGICITGFLP